MGHSTLRQEKNCLNCGHIVEDRYCSHCGQENLEFRTSTWHLLVHYVADLFHYDGRTLYSLRNLFRYPGKVPKEYLEGRRKTYIEPIRFYILSSTVFFLLVFTLLKPVTHVTDKGPRQTLSQRIFYLEKERQYRSGTPDTIPLDSMLSELRHELDSLVVAAGDSVSREPTVTFSIPDSTEQDSMGWFARFVTKRSEARRDEFMERYQGNMNQGFRALLDEFLHKLPQLIFLSLPFFALCLKIFWYNRRRSYVEHLIFSIFQYGYFYTLLILFMLIQWLVTMSDSEIVRVGFELLTFGFLLYLILYLWLSLRRFYRGRWAPMLIRFGLLLLCMLVIILDWVSW